MFSLTFLPCWSYKWVSHSLANCNGLFSYKPWFLLDWLYKEHEQVMRRRAAEIISFSALNSHCTFWIGNGLYNWQLTSNMHRLTFNYKYYNVYPLTIYSKVDISNIISSYITWSKTWKLRFKSSSLNFFAQSSPTQLRRRKKGAWISERIPACLAALIPPSH